MLERGIVFIIAVSLVAAAAPAQADDTALFTRRRGGTEASGRRGGDL